MKKSIKNLIYTTIFILFFVINSANCQSTYSINIDNGKTKISFHENWIFSEILIPTCSLKIWGNLDFHNAAILELGTEKHILSCNEDEEYLRYSAITQPIKEISLVSLSKISKTTKPLLPKFVASLQKTKQIEDEILSITKNEINFIKDNNCFSCHTLIPTSFAIKTAKNKGYNISSETVNQLISQISALQNQDGSYFFIKDPSYGKITTTLSSLFIISLLKDFSISEFQKISNKADDFLEQYRTPEEPLANDFCFEPLFNKNITNLFFETFFLENYYLTSPENKSKQHFRAQLLRSIAEKQKDNMLLPEKLILLSGIPYSFQVEPKERVKIQKELNNYNKYSKNSHTSAILKILANYAEYLIFHSIEKKKISIQSDKDIPNIYEWKCLEKVLYNNPKYLNGTYDE